VATNPEFFSVTAQVIPLLLLVGLIDHAGTPGPDDGPRHRLGGPVRTLAFVRLTSMAALLAGEVAALVAVAGRPTRLERECVVFALALGALLVLDRFCDREIDRLNETMRRPARVAVVLVFFLVTAGLVGAAALAAL
jgi:4-hydroxybenzoate polyprenyltransferase